MIQTHVLRTGSPCQKGGTHSFFFNFLHVIATKEILNHVEDVEISNFNSLLGLVDTDMNVPQPIAIKTRLHVCVHYV